MPTVSPAPTGPPFDRFLATAERVAQQRPEVDLDLARELFSEVATLLYNGLVLDELDDHDAAAVVDGLCADLVTPDPGAAIRARAEAARQAPGDLHDAEAAWVAYLNAISVLRL